MANYINITLDTIGPSGVGILINGASDTVITTATTIDVTCSDADLSGYQMKIWGTADAPTESDAVWETYQTKKNIILPSGDGLKTVYVKVRDDVWNESATASDTVTLYEKIPAVSGLTVSKSKLSLIAGMNSSSGYFNVDENIDAIKIMIVQNINDRYNASTNVQIPTANGSKIYLDSEMTVVSGDSLETDEGYLIEKAKHMILFEINAADIAAASPGDGVKILKVFVRSAETGNWSV